MQYLKDFLDNKANKYNQPDFIELDPISIPHKFSRKEDIEIAGFLAATLAWGNRKSILKSLNQLMIFMDNAPYDFVINSIDKELEHLNEFKYRTFNGTDCKFFIKSLQNIYKTHDGLETVFTNGFKKSQTIKNTIVSAKNIFFSINHPERTTKHLSNPNIGSAAKRINMFLRWMVRDDKNGVDFGLWKNIPSNKLMIPLDVHSGTIARNLGLLNRKQNDWKAVEELTNVLKEFDAHDPIKYDFALFGVGVNKDY
ncbi:MAG: TIGR02757 family protein [Salinivirgaceae bacterium]|nr:TIGR02757 family protein [Salinivirgaceae bacterium]